MDRDHEGQTGHTMDLRKIGEDVQPRLVETERPRETPLQMLRHNGLPAWLGASAAMLVMGTTLVPAIAVGAIAGMAFTAFTFVRPRAQS